MRISISFIIDVLKAKKQAPVLNELRGLARDSDDG